MARAFRTRGEWPKVLAAYFEKQFPGLVTFSNVASSGKESNWGAANLGKRVLPKNPDLVFIEFSMNDAATKHNIPVEKAVASLATMVKALRQQNPQVDIVLMTMNTVWDSPLATTPERAALRARPQVYEYYESYRQYARERGLPLVDHYQNWARLQREDKEKFTAWIPDGCHPIPEGSLAVTWPAIEALLEKARAAAAAAP